MSTAPLRARMPRQILTEPVGCQPLDLLERAGFLEQVRRARDDFEPRDRPHPALRFFIQFDDGLVVAADDQERRRLDGASASPARSGRPPRDTTAAEISGRSAAAINAAAAPVLAPK